MHSFVISLKRRACFQLLYRTTSWQQTLLKSLVWLAVGQIAVRVMRAMTILLVARRLGAFEYGRFALAYSLVTLFTVAMEGGLLTIAAREFAADKRTESILPDIFGLKLSLALCAGALILGGMFWITHDLVVKSLIVLLLVQQIIFDVGGAAYAIIRARQHTQREAALLFVQNSLLLLATFVALNIAPSAAGVACAQVASALVWLCAVRIAIRSYATRLTCRFRWSVFSTLLWQCWPLLATGIAASVCLNIDSIIMGKLGRLTDVGRYTASAKLVQTILLVPLGLMSIAIVPAFANTATNPDAHFFRRWEVLMEELLILGSYLATELVIAAPSITGAVFGASYAPMESVLQVLTLSIMLMYLYTPYLQALIIFRQQRRLLWAQVLAACVNVTANLIAVPAWGAQGAATAAVLSNATLLLLLSRLANRYTPIAQCQKAFRSSVTTCGLTFCVCFVLAMINKEMAMLVTTALFLGVAIRRYKRRHFVIGQLSPVPQNQ